MAFYLKTLFLADERFLIITKCKWAKCHYFLLLKQGCFSHAHAIVFSLDSKQICIVRKNNIKNRCNCNTKNSHEKISNHHSSLCVNSWYFSICHRKKCKYSCYRKRILLIVIQQNCCCKWY